MNCPICFENKMLFSVCENKHKICWGCCQQILSSEMYDRRCRCEACICVIPKCPFCRSKEFGREYIWQEIKDRACEWGMYIEFQIFFGKKHTIFDMEGHTRFKLRNRDISYNIKRNIFDTGFQILLDDIEDQGLSSSVYNGYDKIDDDDENMVVRYKEVEIDGEIYRKYPVSFPCIVTDKSCFHNDAFADILQFALL